MRRRTSAVFAAFSHWQAVPAGRYPGRRGGLPDPAGYRRSDNTASAPFWHRTPARSAQRPLGLSHENPNASSGPAPLRATATLAAYSRAPAERQASSRRAPKAQPSSAPLPPAASPTTPHKTLPGAGHPHNPARCRKFCSHLPLFPFCTRQGPIRPAPSARHFTRFIAAQPGIREAHAWHPLVRLPPRSRNSQGNPSTYRAGAAALQW